MGALVSRALDDLSSDFRPLAVEVLARLVERGVSVMIVDTLRTPAEHQANLARGVSRAPLSKHLPRHLRMAVTEGDPDRDKADAIDLAPYEVYALHGPDKVKWDPADPVWAIIGAVGEGLGLRWGGRWRDPHDPGHLELSTPVLPQGRHA